MTEETRDSESPEMSAEMGDVAAAAAGLAEATVQPVSFAPLSPGAESGERNNLDLVPGSVVTLDKKAEEPVDLRVNGTLIARGEVVLVDEVYGIRLTQIVETAGRIESLKSAE